MSLSPGPEISSWEFDVRNTSTFSNQPSTRTFLQATEETRKIEACEIEFFDALDDEEEQSGCYGSDGW
jgi:hypothetical protein